MKILIVNKAIIPVVTYGGTERVIWDLALSLVEMGHELTFLVPHGSSCDFAKVIYLDDSLPLENQIPKDIDVIHFQFQPENFMTEIPYIVTEHGNAFVGRKLDINTVFLSENHANRHNSTCFVYNGLNWNNYGEVKIDTKRIHYHFLGKAAWRVKNVKGAIAIADQAKVPLHVMGGSRFNFKRGIRLTFSKNIIFHGMVGGEDKLSILRKSKGLILPVTWHEPFGLAVIESLYFGCPVFSTPYGSLKELVPNQCGVLSNKLVRLKESILNNKIDPFDCHQHAKLNFSVTEMAQKYLKCYTMVISGIQLNKTHPFLVEAADNKDWYQ